MKILQGCFLVCVGSTPLKSGDIILVAKLKYRINHHKEKGQKIHGNQLKDYEFFLVSYEDK